MIEILEYLFPGCFDFLHYSSIRVDSFTLIRDDNPKTKTEYYIVINKTNDNNTVNNDKFYIDSSAFEFKHIESFIRNFLISEFVTAKSYLRIRKLEFYRAIIDGKNHKIIFSSLTSPIFSLTNFIFYIIKNRNIHTDSYLVSNLYSPQEIGKFPYIISANNYHLFHLYILPKISDFILPELAHIIHNYLIIENRFRGD